MFLAVHFFSFNIPMLNLMELLSAKLPFKVARNSAAEELSIAISNRAAPSLDAVLCFY